MRLALVILSMTAIAIGLVKLRSDEVTARHDIQTLQQRLVMQRQVMAEQDVRLSQLKAVEAVRARAEDMGLGLVPPGTADPKPQPALAKSR